MGIVRSKHKRLGRFCSEGLMAGMRPLHVLAFIGRTHIFPRVARFCARHRMTSTDTAREAG